MEVMGKCPVSSISVGSVALFSEVLCSIRAQYENSFCKYQIDFLGPRKFYFLGNYFPTYPAEIWLNYFIFSFN